MVIIFISYVKLPEGTLENGDPPLTCHLGPEKKPVALEGLFLCVHFKGVPDFFFFWSVFGI